MLESGPGGLFRGTTRFAVSRRLGEGGIGVVYEAYDRELGKPVALKTLHTLTPAAVVRLKAEFRQLRDLLHPNLVRLGELVEQDGVWFYTMELIEGVPFLHWVRPVVRHEPALLQVQPVEGSIEDDGVVGLCRGRPTLPPTALLQHSRLRDAIRQVAEGLMAIHQAGHVHRDVKPSNVLVTPQGRVVLLDFGLATTWQDDDDGSTASGVVGTPAYMPPEQAASRKVGPSADWYAVGTMLYEALAGRLPYEGRTLNVLLAKQLGPPTPPSTSGGDEDLVELCIGLLRSDPRERLGGEAILDCVEPTPSRRRGAGWGAPSTLRQPAEELVGRRQELGRLQRAIEATRAGTVAAICIHGEVGIGKTALVREFCRSVLREAPESIVLSGRCFDRESVPYKAVDGVIDELASLLARMPAEEVGPVMPRRAGLLPRVFPVLRTVDAIVEAPQQEVQDPRVLRSLVFTGLRELFAKLAERRPVVIVIEDLQWADADSLVLLREILREPDPPPLLLVTTCRVGLRTEADVNALGLVEHVFLGPLTQEESAELADTAVGVLVSPERRAAVADAIVREARGHPLFVRELAAHAAGGADDDCEPRETNLDDAIWDRVLSLDHDARAMLVAIVIASAPVALEVVARAADVEWSAFDDRLRRLCLLRLAHATGILKTDRVEVVHDRIRSCVVQRTDGDQLRLAHRRVARAMEVLGAQDIEAMAEHYRHAGEEEIALRYTLQAAENASRALAFDHAARQLALALQLIPQDSPRRRELLVELARALASAGRSTEAARTYLHATAGANAADALEMRSFAARHLVMSGRIDEGMEALRAALASARLPFPRSALGAVIQIVFWRMWLAIRGEWFRSRDESSVSSKELARVDLCWNTGIGLGMVDHVRGHAFQVRGLVLALSCGEPYRIGRALATEAGMLAGLGGRGQKRVDRTLAAAERIAQQVGNDHLLAWNALARAVSDLMCGRFLESNAHAGEALEILRDRCTSVAWELASCRLWLARSLLHLGRLNELVDVSTACLLDFQDRGDLFGETNLHVAVFPFLALARDQVERARRYVRMALDRWSVRDFHVQHYYALLSEVACDLYEGNPSSALHRLDVAEPALRRAQLFRVQFVRIAVLDARARSLLSLAEKLPSKAVVLRREASACIERIEDERMPWAMRMGLVLRGIVAWQQGEKEQASAFLQEALERYGEAGQELHTASLRLTLGRMALKDVSEGHMRTAQVWMEQRRVRAPLRIAQMLIPGIRPPG